MARPTDISPDKRCMRCFLYMSHCCCDIPEANKCPGCCGELETHPVDDAKQYCPHCTMNKESINQLVADNARYRKALLEIQTLPSVREDESSQIAFRALRGHQ